jgi:GDPmannose 4,6-dehydratase
MAVAAIAKGKQDLYLGNLNSQRDWGHAKDYVEAMWRILQQDVPEDYVIATGVTTILEIFVIMAFAEVGTLTLKENKKMKRLPLLLVLTFVSDSDRYSCT